MRFTLAQLEAVLWVVRLGSFRAAATRLNVTPPAVSVRVRELEQTLGSRLFLRESYRAKPTPLGRDIAAHAERMIAAGEELEARFAPHEELSGPVRIGVADTFAVTCLSQLMRGIEVRYPRARAEIRVDFSVRLNEALQAGDLDIAVATAPTPGALVTVAPLVELRLDWVAAPRFAIAGALRGRGSRPAGASPTYGPADLARLPLITNPDPSNLFATIADWFAAAGVKAGRVNTCSSLMIMTLLARDGAGVSLLPTAVLRRELESRALRILPVSPALPSHSLSVAYRRDAPGSGLRLLAKLIGEIVQGSDLARYRPPGREK